MPKFNVSFTITGHGYVQVDAVDEKEAMEKAENGEGIPSLDDWEIDRFTYVDAINQQR